MRADAPVFQVYRLGPEGTVWWRVVSPNGRGLARAVTPFASVDAAYASIGFVRRVVAELEPSMRLTKRARWRWTLSLDGFPVVESLFDLDRRVRCEHAWRAFVEVAPVAALDPAVHSYRSGSRPRAERSVE